MYGATPHIGHGLEARSLETALEWKAEVVVAQGTSTDPGPYYLGAGSSYMQLIQVKNDLSTLIRGCYQAGVPFIVSVGGPGDNQSLAAVLEVVDEIAQEQKIDLKLAVIQGELSKEWLMAKLDRGGKTERLVRSKYLKEKLDKELVRESKHIVAQMGPEPIMKALETPGLHGVITGRALDVGLFVALPLMRGFPIDLSMHFSTVMHDGALAAIPGSGSDGIFGTLYEDHFVLIPPNPKRRCTPISVAAMSFYERSNPFEEVEPSGILDVSQAVYTQIDNRSVRVTGAKYTLKPYTIKIEGAALQGYRAVCMVGACDPRFISSLPTILDTAKAEIVEKFKDYKLGTDWEFQWRVYGRDAVLGSWADLSKTPSEVGILIDIMAKTQDLANALCSVSRSALFHQGYPGRKTTAGNLALPFSPVEIQVGPSYRYNIWHTLELDNPSEPFPITYQSFPRR